MNASGLRWMLFDGPEDLITAAAQAVREHAAKAIDERRAFRIVLAGGSTPQPVYALLSRADTDWALWHIYFGDERCLPRGSPQRNDVMARERWLDRTPVPQRQIHPIPAELGAHEAAVAYCRSLRNVADFDLVLLGLGEDGHTASLFPGGPLGSGPSAAAALAITGAPKPPRERVSLSAARLRRTRATIMLVSGAGKRWAVERLRSGDTIPAASVCPPSGMVVMLDRAAAGQD